MAISMDVFYFGSLFFVSFFITHLVCRYADQLGLVQAPNHRSSHTLPTPHSGGIGIVLAGTCAGIYAVWGQGAQGWIVLVLSLVLAMMGLRDDVSPLSARLRFMMQMMVYTLLLWTLGSFADLWHTFAAQPYGGWCAVFFSGLLLLSGLWWANLFNFMDGIDGLASAQAFFMLVMAASLGALFSPQCMDTHLWLWMLGVAAATAGFGVINWPPAKIFMGDVGSMYLAFFIFVSTQLSIQERWLTYPVWLILGAVFIVDATITLLRRMIRGERWFEAHRSHIYQQLARRLRAHRPVTVLTIIINVMWLAPLAWASLAYPYWAWYCVMVAYVPLIVCAIFFDVDLRKRLHA
ncbi:MAG: glycosyltransferase family 4 protein [Ottowia sp.]|nr:glycosyltransferase family 4 protein [Ottowia sp.]